MPLDNPGLHPDPPSGLATSGLPIRSVEREWSRIHKIDKDPIFFGNAAEHRFDDPMRKYGVLHIGEDPFCAFIETYGHSTGVRFVTRSSLGQRGLAAVVTTGALELVDLTANGLAKMGADARLCDGDYTVAQKWSRAFWSHPAQPDGVLFRSRHDPAKICAAVFDRASGRLQAQPRGALSDSRISNVLAEILERYDFGII